MRLVKKHFSIGNITILLCFLLLNISCQQNSKETKLTNKLTFTTSKNIWCSIPLIAVANGYFKNEGLDVDLKITDGGRYCMDAILSKSADIGTVVETNIAYLGFNENYNALVIGNVVKSTDYAIVARKSSGIRKITDLNGKLLAYAPAMGGEMYANRVINKYNLKPSIRKLQPKAIPGAIIAKEIDAAATWEPFVNTITTKLGNDAIVFRDTTAFQGRMHLGVRKEWLIQNKEVLFKIFRALKNAEKFINENPEKSQSILSKEINLPLDVVKSIWPFFQIRFNMDKNDLIFVTTEVGKWIQKAQPDYANKKLPDYSVYYDDSYYLSFTKGL